MKKISYDAAVAFKEGQKFKRSNTEVLLGRRSVSLYLYNNRIARECDGVLQIGMCGWPTQTTRDRLNVLLRVLGIPSQFSQKKGIQFMSIPAPGMSIGSIDIVIASTEFLKFDLKKGTLI